MLDGDKELLRNINKLSVDLNRATIDAVNATATDVRSTAVKSIQKKSGGELVTRYSQSGKKYSHVAAAEGSAPNTDTGALVRSIALEPAKTEATAYVGTSIEYGKFLEFGTRAMGARPWLEPALNDNDKAFRKHLERFIDDQIDKAAK